jgi:hypothetical protein
MLAVAREGARQIVVTLSVAVGRREVALGRSYRRHRDKGPVLVLDSDTVCDLLRPPPGGCLPCRGREDQLVGPSVTHDRGRRTAFTPRVTASPRRPVPGELSTSGTTPGAWMMARC